MDHYCPTCDHYLATSDPCLTCGDRPIYQPVHSVKFDHSPRWYRVFWTFIAALLVFALLK